MNSGGRTRFNELRRHSATACPVFFGSDHFYLSLGPWLDALVGEPHEFVPSRTRELAARRWA